MSASVMLRQPRLSARCKALSITRSSGAAAVVCDAVLRRRCPCCCRLRAMGDTPRWTSQVFEPKPRNVKSTRDKIDNRTESEPRYHDWIAVYVNAERVDRWRLIASNCVC